MSAPKLDPRMLDVLAERHRGVLAVIRPNGRPHLSTIAYAYDRDADLVRISVTDSRAKTRSLRADPRLTLHVSGKSVWTWVAVEGTGELTPVAADPHDDTVEELITYYRGTAGEHPDWDEYRAAMVSEGRLVVRFRPERTYGQVAD
jgi:PPOX class probable F420-dependent enzyme